MTAPKADLEKERAMAGIGVEIAPGVHVRTSRRMATTSTTIVARDRALLVDPAWMPDELDAHAAGIHDRGLEVAGGFAQSPRRPQVA